MKKALSSRLMSLLALMLIAAMMLTMVGCGNKEPEDIIEEGDVSTTAPAATESTGIIEGTVTIDPSATESTDASGTEVVDPSATDATGSTAPSKPGVTGTAPTAGTTGKTTGGKTTGKPTQPSYTVPSYTVPSYTVPSYTVPSYTGPTSGKPTTGKPTNAPTGNGPTNAPTKAPTQAPTQPGPTLRPTASTSVSATQSTSVTTIPIGQTVLEQVPDSLKGTTIKMQIWWTAGDSDNNKVKEFKAATGIDVKYETAAMDKYQSNLSAKIMASNAPAIAAIINEWYPQPITRGLMQPITNVKGLDFTDGNVYALSLMDQFGYKGQHYGINLKTSTNCTFHVMFFNKDLLRQSGVKQDPYQLWKAGQWNWNTCLEIAKKCDNEKRGISGLSNVGQYYWMLSAGEDYVKTTNAGLKSNVNAPGVLEAWNWNWDMINTHKVVDTSYTGQTPFYQGKAAMLGIGSFAMQYDGGKSNYVPKNMKDDWSVVPFPSPAGKTYAAADGTVWGFPDRVTGNKLEAAAWYLRYYLDEFNIPEVREKFFDPKHPESWEVMNWMWNQKIQSYNSVGVLTYGGEYDAYSIQYSLLDEADTKAKIKSNLESWVSVIESNINKIVKEMEG